MGVSAFWQDRPTLVTGASGFVGGWLVDRLVESRATVVCLVRDWVSESQLIRNHERHVTIVRGDVCDLPFVERALGEYEIDTVFHLAAQSVVGIANRNPISTFESNVRGTWSVLEACRRTPTIRQIVVASSDKAYGSHATLPYTEATPLQGRYPYDVSKSCADLIARSYALTYDLPVVTSRCANLYGGGDLNWNRLVPGTIRSALNGQRPIVRSDGKRRRDYLFVEDGVAAYLQLAEAAATRHEIVGKAFNFGHNAPITVLDLVERILHACGRADLPPDVLARAEHEIDDQFLDATLASTALGWKPSVGFDEGLARTVAWYRQYLGGIAAG
jgi:CDP-glucose 4,6-dehydratase